MVTANVPPLEGCSATSPKLAEKVEMSSCAYCPRPLSSQPRFFFFFFFFFFFSSSSSLHFLASFIHSFIHSFFLSFFLRLSSNLCLCVCVDARTYAARSIHLHCVQNAIVIRGRTTAVWLGSLAPAAVLAVVVASESSCSFGDMSVS